ncbi:MAG TPA: CoA-binding protein [Dehalococcoidales bacterium]|nr:CoA-binding protein [Dehalococcoidales bacterium]
MSNHRNADSLRPFFEPESVAVIGASRTPGKGGYNIIENLLRLGYAGKIYPINPRARQILGLTAYPELKQTPGPPELALIVLPPSLVLKSLEECIARGVKAVIIESAGFAEMDRSGARLEKRIARMAKNSGIRIMGPNSVGTINPGVHFDSSLGRLNKLFLPEGDIRQGTVGFIGQTGLFTGVFLPLINSEIGISKIACLGNKCDVDESDMLEYFGEDPRTRIITMYLENIKDGQRFLGLSRRIVREKPIVVLKSAVTEGGARASATHTGSIAGEDRVYDAAFRQSGILRVRSFEQLWDVARAFVHAPLPQGNRVAIINLAGSGCVTAVDACVVNGLRIAELSPATRARIKTVYPDWWRVRSPVDVWTAVEANGFEATYTTVTRAVLEDSGVDTVVVIMAAVDWVPGKNVPTLFADIKKDFPHKPILAVSPLGDRRIYLGMRQGFQDIGIPSYTSDEDAIISLAALYRYRQYLLHAD